MHTDVCNDSIEWWPEGSPTDIDVATLPVSDAITTPRRIPGVGPWLGFWGPSFSGLRIGITAAAKSYPVVNGLAVPYPKDPCDATGIDVFLTRDTGGSGIVSVARFRSREAAQAWGGSPTPSTSSGAGILTPSGTLTVNRIAGISDAGDTAVVSAAAGRLGIAVQCVGGTVGLVLSVGGGTTGVELSVGQTWEPPAGLRYTGALMVRGKTGEATGAIETQVYT